ncbi:DUF1823 family protein [Phormidium tenue]|uniref:DUF1823 domain-containing protein n=1 Tax=Phormidium tenue NIES-30 TaxID=549789 RepID=A0A1U7J8Q9_9CYAN|nr:DUF1823 family protein [Phormidium tenue]MBD2231355.1 DUF1823 family protein [Phormidium tenue FACHB-1052]OKH49651.1 hypothetical protein NIES30_07050 [Phormidium tenue NIES-30]
MPSMPPLTDDTLWAILNDELDDDTVNRLVWCSLSYQEISDGWDSSAVEPAWAEKYPEPPNFIESRPATVQLTRSIPPEYKQLLKEELGFKGYSIDQLIPRLTRRATMVSWLLSQRKQSMGGD